MQGKAFAPLQGQFSVTPYGGVNQTTRCYLSL